MALLPIATQQRNKANLKIVNLSSMKEEKKANRTNKMRNKQCSKMTEKDERIEEEWKFKQEI